MPGVFILLRFVADQKFSFAMEDLKNCSSLLLQPPEGEHVARNYGYVGLTRFLIDGENRLRGWSFLFPLHNYSDPDYVSCIKSIPPAHLFGHFYKNCLLSFFSKILSASEVERSLLKLDLMLYKNN